MEARQSKSNLNLNLNLKSPKGGFKSRVLSSLYLISVFFWFSTNTGCSKDVTQPNIEVLQDMMESPAIKEQEFIEDQPDHRGMLVPPENTVPVGFKPYKYKFDPEGAGKNLKNPYAVDRSDLVLLTGQKQFETHCAVCHGFKGEGQNATSVGEKMVLKPPQLTSDKIKSWPDGRIYHVIADGQGIMPSYASHVPQNVRWQLVNYIRHLQSK